MLTSISIISLTRCKKEDRVGTVSYTHLDVYKRQLYYFKHQDPGAFVSISGGGVLASSKHKEQAQAFIKWITGKQGQDELRTNNAFEYAVGVDAASNPKLTPLKELDAPKVEPSSLNSKKVIELMTQAGLL